MTAMVTAAFFHHVAAFLVFATLLAELVLIRNELTFSSARSLARVDMIYGIAATVLIAAGVTRLFLEKGTAYYFASGSFLLKLTLFVAVGLLSIYPTVKFLGWRKTLREGRVPEVDAGTLRRIRMLIHLELVLIPIIILMAIMMARGIWYVG